MNKHQRNFNRTLATILASLLTAAAAVPSVYAAPEIVYPDGMNCVLVSDDNAVFNVEKADIDGNIYAHDNITFYGSESMEIDGFAGSHGNISDNISVSAEDTTRYTIPDFSSAIERNAQYSKMLESSTEISETELDITDSIYVSGKLTLDEVKLKGQGYVTAEDTIKCHLIQNENSDDYVVFYSKDGDIIISGSELTINGIIYAPNGKVIFNVKKLTVNGGIYAEDVEFNGTELYLNKNQKYDTLVADKLTIEAGEDREIYVGESLELEGSSNYENVIYKWSSDESVSFDNANSQTTLASFSKVGTYTVKLTGTLNTMSDSDTLTVKVNPDPSKTFTTTDDFSAGELNGTLAKEDYLTLESEEKTVSEITNSYISQGVSGINVESTVSKDRITSQSDEFGITYDLKGVGSTVGVEEQGIDFVFLIDNSGSMSGEYLQNAQVAAKTILTYMREGDRYAISDLGRVHIGFTDDKELLEAEIDKVRFGSGSSEPDDGINIVNQLFDEQSSENRQKYIILLADGEAYDSDYSMDTMKQYSQDAADRNIKIFALAMRNDIQNMQEAAIITKGIYKNAPDGETIRKFMEKFGAEIFNSAARNVLFKTTVADINKIDLENISPAPSAVTENDDGSAEISWSFDTFEIDEEKSICIPVKSNMFSESGYERITCNTALYYNDKEGKGQKTYLDDVTLPCDIYKNNGTWSAVYDSQRDNCEWTGIYWDGIYPSDSLVNVYISVSNDGVNYTEDTKVVNYTVPENLKGRYIRVKTELKKGSDGSAPVIEDITVISGTMKLSAPFESAVSAAADTNGSVYANRPTTLYADITGTSDSIRDISWTVNGTENYMLDTSNFLMPTLIFEESGEYSITLKVSDENGHYCENTFHIDVKEEENADDIVFEDGSEPVKYTVEGADFEYYNYNNGRGKTIRLITENLSAIAWVSVRLIPDEPRYISRWNNVWVYHIEEDFTSTFTLPNYSGTLEITAYDWSGNPYTYTFDTLYDNTRPEVSLTGSESKYPKGRFYTKDPYTVSVTATDNGAIDSVTLYLNDEEVALDENNSYTFTPTEEKYYSFKATVFDKAGNSSTASHSKYISNDTAEPIFNPFTLNRRTASIGNEIVFTANAYDNETGMKSVVYTVNDEEITLDENGEYKYIAGETGEFVFKGVAVDNRDNTREQTLTLTVTEDTQNPSVSISATRSREILVNTTTLVTVTASDNVAVAKIDVDVNGETQTLDENNQFTLTAEQAGDITITATAYDNAGNSRTATYRLKAIDEDTSAPSISYYPSKRYEYQDRQQTVSVTSGDNTQVVSRKLYLDGTELEPTENGYSNPEYNYTDYYTFNPSEIGVGEHTFKAVTTDGSGNKAELEKTFTVSDTTVPSVSFDGGYYFNTNDNVVLTLKVTDNTEIESITGTLNGEPLALQNINEQTLTIENAAAGTYIFSVTAKDIYGNERTNTRTITVRDTLKPVITLSNVAEEYFIPDKPVIRMTVTDNIEVSTVTVKMNGEDLEYNNSEIILPETLAEGDYTITITARDTSGNTETKTVKFTISMPRDTTPPVIEEINIIPRNPEVGTPIQVYVKASDDSGSVDIEVSTNGTKFTYENGAYIYTPQTSGEISITIKAADPSGNVSEINATNYIYEDAAAPVVTVDYQASMTVNQTQTITVSATDNKSVSSVFLQMNGTNIALSNGKYVFAPTSTGDYQFTAAAADSAGNIGTKEFMISVSEKTDETDLAKYLVNEAETGLTQDMKNKADELETASAVYDFVKNNIYIQYYQGSRKGAAATYEQLGGNDVDTSSLLIAMLRYLKYPARYVSGTVQYTDDELLKLTGADNISSAIDCINASGYASQTYYTPSGRKLIRIEHTWVEVYAPLSECGIDSNEKSWITLDGWLKETKRTTESLKNSALSEQAQNCRKIIDLAQQIDDNTEKDTIIKTFTDMENIFKKDIDFTEHSIRQEKYDYLPRSAEISITERTSVSASVSENICDIISFSVDGEKALSLKTSEAFGKRIILQYLPASEEDEQKFVAQKGDMTKMGVSGFNVKPSLTVDGEIVWQGNSTTLGRTQYLDTEIKSAGTTQSLRDELITGSMYALVVDSGDVSEAEYKRAYDNTQSNIDSYKAGDDYSEKYLGALLNYAGKLYFVLKDNCASLLAETFNVEHNCGVSFGVFGYEYHVLYNAWTGLPRSLQSGSFITDIDRDKYTPISLTDCKENTTVFSLANGYVTSFFEGYIWELITDSQGISTAAILKYAVDNDMEICYIDSSNVSEVTARMSSDDGVKQEIRNYAGRGYFIIAPISDVQIGDWKGTGYIMMSPDGTSNTFRVSGGINGGGSSEKINIADVIGSDFDDEKSVQNAYIILVKIRNKDMLDRLKGYLGNIGKKPGVGQVLFVKDAFGIGSSMNGIYSARNSMIDFYANGGDAKPLYRELIQAINESGLGEKVDMTALENYVNE